MNHISKNYLICIIAVISLYAIVTVAGPEDFFNNLFNQIGNSFQSANEKYQSYIYIARIAAIGIVTSILSGFISCVGHIIGTRADKILQYAACVGYIISLGLLVYSYMQYASLA